MVITTNTILIGLVLFGPPVREGEELSHCLGPLKELHFAGEVNHQPIRGYLHSGFPSRFEKGLSGVLMNPSEWSPFGEVPAVTIDGEIDVNCHLDLKDDSGNVWRLEVVHAVLTGVRETNEGEISDVYLEIVEPIDCSGAGEWVEFHDDSWPITFEYPRSWKLAVDETDLTIQCPDPAAMAWGRGVIYMSKREKRRKVVSDDGMPGVSIGPFTSYDHDTRWWIGQCASANPVNSRICSPARVAELERTTILQGSFGDHKQYRDAAGGMYLGLGGGRVHYAVLIRDQIVSISLEDAHAFIDELDSHGPVIFEGEGVGERLIRSIAVDRATF